MCSQIVDSALQGRLLAVFVSVDDYWCIIG